MSTKTRGPWTVKGTIERYKNDYFQVLEDEVIRPDQRPGNFSTILLRPGVSVLAVDDEQNVYLTSEYRYAIERESIEVVSGGIDGNEPTLVCARRELREEVGIEAKEWTSLGVVDPLTSIVRSPAELFLARDLTFVEPQHESTEIIRIIRVTLAEAVRMVMDSEITHGPSAVLILKAHNYLRTQ
ncbi:MAG TPA: NUDIX hydrolase [Pyrinomonadaceae bacterium]|nr:NUDIX hydrolase [Pyrinomonadaceae bacterium]